MRRRSRLRSLRAAVPAAGLIVLLVIASQAPAGGAPGTSAAKKKTAVLKDGRYTFKDESGRRKNTMVVSGGGKKVRFTIVHFDGGTPGEFPYCQRTVVDHGTYKLKPDYVIKTALGFKDPDLYTRKAPAVETDGSAGGGMSANGTIDPKKLILSGQFQIRLQDVTGGINTCFEAPTFSEAKLVRVK